MIMSETLIWAVAAVAVTAIVCWSALRAWRGWLELRRYQIAAEHGALGEGGGSGLRIEFAGFKERLRKLEAIATGVDP
jgi:hypothetical protein